MHYKYRKATKCRKANDGGYRFKFRKAIKELGACEYILECDGSFPFTVVRSASEFGGREFSCVCERIDTWECKSLWCERRVPRADCTPQYYTLPVRSKVTCADCDSRYKKSMKKVRAIRECEYLLHCNTMVFCHDCTPQHKRIVARMLAAEVRADGGESFRQAREWVHNTLKPHLIESGRILARKVLEKASRFEKEQDEKRKARGEVVRILGILAEAKASGGLGAKPPAD